MHLRKRISTVFYENFVGEFFKWAILYVRVRNSVKGCEPRRSYAVIIELFRIACSIITDGAGVVTSFFPFCFSFFSSLHCLLKQISPISCHAQNRMSRISGKYPHKLYQLLPAQVLPTPPRIRLNRVINRLGALAVTKFQCYTMIS